MWEANTLNSYCFTAHLKLWLTWLASRGPSEKRRWRTDSLEWEYKTSNHWKKLTSKWKPCNPHIKPKLSQIWFPKHADVSLMYRHLIHLAHTLRDSVCQFGQASGLGKGVCCDQKVKNTFVPLIGLCENGLFTHEVFLQIPQLQANPERNMTNHTNISWGTSCKTPDRSSNQGCESWGALLARRKNLGAGFS